MRRKQRGSQPAAGALRAEAGRNTICCIQRAGLAAGARGAADGQRCGSQLEAQPASCGAAGGITKGVHGRMPRPLQASGGW